LGPADGPDTDTAVLDARRPDGRGLRIHFSWQEDRYGHEIAYVDDQTTDTLLVTESGSAQAHWPVSPPLQQISWLESPHQRRVALLVGMAGKSHWSLSVEADQKEARLSLDVACRFHRLPPWLGSTYRCLRTFSGQHPGPVHFRVGRLVGTMVAESPDADQPVALDVSGARLSIVPSLDRINAPATVRWKYQVWLESPQS
jgi:hypothetical protein